MIKGRAWMGKIERMLFRTKRYLHNPFCFWCGERMRLFANRINNNIRHAAVEEMATIEHLQPRCDGGSDKDGNLELVHKRCNR